jgi:hypothetical protein
MRQWRLQVTIQRRISIEYIHALPVRSEVAEGTTSTTIYKSEECTGTAPDDPGPLE